MHKSKKNSREKKSLKPYCVREVLMVFKQTKKHGLFFLTQIQKKNIIEKMLDDTTKGQL